MKLMFTFHNFANVPNKTSETLTHSHDHSHVDQNNTVYATQLTQTNQVMAHNMEQKFSLVPLKIIPNLIFKCTVSCFIKILNGKNYKLWDSTVSIMPRFG
jgi:hypothetical protein